MSRLEDTINAVLSFASKEDESSKVVKSDEETKNSDIIMKQFDEDERLVLGVVLEPETQDLHMDIYSSVEIRKAQENFNEHCMQGNLEHIANTDELVITKSFIMEVDSHIGEQPVKEGSWIMEMYVSNEATWKSVKEGGFTGFSIGCSALHEDV
jgi:hypothetical protein